MKYTDLNALLVEVTKTDARHISSKAFAVAGLSLKKLRDVLYKLGDIYYEDLENKVYVAGIRGGFARMNLATVALHLDGKKLYISVSAKYGLLKQSTKEEVINELKYSLEGYIIQE